MLTKINLTSLTWVPTFVPSSENKIIKYKDKHREDRNGSVAYSF